MSFDEDGNYDELHTLYEIVKSIKDAVPYTFEQDGKLEVYLPVTPNSDTMFKVNSNKLYRQIFIKKISEFEEQLRNACNASSEYEAGKYVANVLGDGFPLPEKETVDGANTYGRRAEFG